MDTRKRHGCRTRSGASDWFAVSEARAPATPESAGVRFPVSAEIDTFPEEHPLPRHGLEDGLANRQRGGQPILGWQGSPYGEIEELLEQGSSSPHECHAC